MANIALRSPQYKFIEIPSSGVLSTTCAISVSGTLRYTIIKNNPSSSNGVNVDISELARDYLTILYRSGFQPQSIAIVTVMKNFAGLNGTGSQVGSTVTYTDDGWEAYGKFTEGENPELPFSLRTKPTWLQATQTNNSDVDTFTIFLPIGAGTRVAYLKSNNVVDVFVVSSTAVSIAASVDYPAMKIKRINCTKYGLGTKIVFINKYGIQQDLWFFLKDIDKLNRSNEKFMSNTLETPNDEAAQYSKQNAPRKVFNTTAQQSYVLSSGYYPEFAVQYFEQLLLSEYIWIQYNRIEKPGSFDVLPVTLKSSSMIQKTSVNDRLIQYTMEFELAANYINNIR